MADSSSGTAGAVPATGRAGDIEPGPGVPTIPIPFKGGPAAAKPHPTRGRVGVTGTVLDRLRSICEVSIDEDEVGDASRDWWPLGMAWALEGELAGRARAVVKPTEATQVGEVLHVCDIAKIPVTAAGGRSGVSGATVPIFGGVILDMCGLSGIRDVDSASLVVDVGPGTFGDRFEAALRSEHGLTCGHWPQSMTLSTVGGWVACRGAGQFSTRYGKIEDMVVGLDVALADGTTITTGGYPRTATGPDLTQLFVGSEGTLGVITGVRLRTHPAPVTELRGAWSVASLNDGLDAFRRILQRGATPAVLRLYDPTESKRNFALDDGRCAVIVLDEGDPAVIDGMWQVVDSELAGAETLDPVFVGRWLEHRNEVSQLESLISGGIVVDTMEVSGGWSTLPAVYEAAMEAIGSFDETLSVSAHCSHSYTDGACLYFTFAGRPAEVGADGRPTPTAKDRYYRAVWDAGTRAVLEAGGSLSHHHGVGLNRSRFMDEALGAGMGLLIAMKSVLDPNHILNPGKLGIPSPWGLPDLPKVQPL
ncbi:MAG: FAD-binding oxidoreductase [Acidimicrobiales bacterium]